MQATLHIDWSNGIPANGTELLNTLTARHADHQAEEIEFTVNGFPYSVGLGTFDASYYWSTGDEESQPFATAAEAQADALRHAMALEPNEEADDGYPSYEQQVRDTYYDNCI